jgi:5-methylthioribose kinase
MFILNANEPKELAAYLQQLKWLDEQETIVSLSKPGEGNMNCAACGDGYRSYCVKQSRGYESTLKFWLPCFACTTEGAFYQKNCPDRYCTANHASKILE